VEQKVRANWWSPISKLVPDKIARRQPAYR